MKKLVLFALFVLVLMPVQADAFKSWQRFGVLTGGVVADNTTLAFTLPVNVGHHSYLYVPTIDSAAIALSCSVDGTNFGTMATLYSATALIDFTYAATTGGKVLRLPDISPCRKLKITSGAAQAADRVFVVFGN